MAIISKTSKINFYKFVQVKKPSEGLPKSEVKLVAALNSNTTAVNNLGRTVNSLALILSDLKTISLSDLEQKQKNQKVFKAKFAKEKTERKNSGFLGNLGANKVKGFFESVLGLLGNLFKIYIGKKVLDWIADPENRKTVKTIIGGIVTFGEFLFKWAEFGISNTIDGLYELFSGETTWWEKTLGFGKAIIGLGTILLGIRYLTNPLKIIKDIGTSIRLLIAFTKGKGALGALGKVGLGAAALWLLSEGVATRPAGDGSLIGNMDAEGRTKGEEGYDPSTKGKPTRATLKARGLLEDAKAQGYIPERAAGGWIDGPQSGYPVSLDGGRSTSFIGHGKEYVARKAGGGAFVVPFNTSATKRMPGLTDKRIGEAQKAGFKLPGFAAGGNLNKQIYMHWTASRYNWKNGPYHTTVQGDGSLHKHKKYNQYTGHTWRRNTGNVGISVAAMKDYNWDRYSPKKKQLDAMTGEAAAVAKGWGWKPSDVSIKNVMTHAEAASNKDGRRPTPNYGPTWWGGTGERSDLHKLKKTDPDGGGGDKLRMMMKRFMGMSNPPVLNESGPGAGADATGGDNKMNSAEYNLLQRLVLAESSGEGELGMALVARSVLNRSGLVQSGVVGPGIFMSKSGSINDIIYGAGPQYSPTKNGSIDRVRSAGDLEKAKKAIEIARNPADLRGRLEAKGNISPEQINYLMASTGFRNYDAAFVDPSQQVNEVKYGNHTFNTASNPGLKTVNSEINPDGGTGGGPPGSGSDSIDRSSNGFGMDTTRNYVGASLLGAKSTRGQTSMGDYSQNSTGVRSGQTLSGTNINSSGGTSSQQMQAATQQRNDAKQRILQFAQAGVQMTVAQVTQNNASAGQIAQQATSLIGTMMNNSSSGAPVMAGTGSKIVSTTAAVLNSFNNPLKGIFK